MLELLIPVGMARPFLGLAVRLQAVAQPMQQVGHDLMTHPMLHPPQFGGQMADALRRPSQRRFRIASRHRFQQAFQIGLQAGVRVHQLLPPASGTPNAPQRQRRRTLQLGNGLADHQPRNAGRFGNRRDSAPANRSTLRSGEKTSCPLVQKGLQSFIARRDPSESFH